MYDLYKPYNIFIIYDLACYTCYDKIKIYKRIKNHTFLHIFEQTNKYNYIRFTSIITVVSIYFAFFGVVITRELMSKRNVATSQNVSLKRFVLLGFMCV